MLDDVLQGAKEKQSASTNSSRELRSSKSAGAAFLEPALLEYELYQLEISEDTDATVDNFEGFLEMCSSEAAIGGDFYDPSMPEYELEASQSCAAIMGGPAGAASSSLSRQSSRDRHPGGESGAKSSSRRNSKEKPREEDSLCAGTSFMGSDSFIISSRKPLQGRPASAKLATLHPRSHEPPSSAVRGRVRPGAAAPRASSMTRTLPARSRTAATSTGTSELAAGRRSASAPSNEGWGSSNRKGLGKSTAQASIEHPARSASPAPAKGLAKNLAQGSAEPITSRAASPAPPLQQQSSILDNEAVHKRLSRILRHQTETMDEERVRRYT